MDEVDVDFAALALARQLFDRQAEHMRRIGEYVEAHCRLESSFGVFLQLLAPQYDEGRQIAVTGFGQGRQIAAEAADRLGETEDAYVEADRAAYDALGRLGTDLGVVVPPWSSPRCTATLPPGPDAPPPGSDDAGPDGWAETKSAWRRTKQTWDVARGSTTRTFTPTDASWLRHPSTPDLVERTTLSHYTGRAVDALAERVGAQATHTSTAGPWQGSYEQLQAQRYRSGFTQGQDLLPDDLGRSRLGSHSVWANLEESRAITAAPNLLAGVADVGFKGMGAVQAVGSAADALATEAEVDRLGDGPQNTSGIDWARS